MDKTYILDEIRRTAAGNGGTSLGQMAFQTATRIRQRDWRGRYWARWSDALREVGLSPNLKKEALSDEVVFGKLIELIRQVGRLPTGDELTLRRREDRTFPSGAVVRRVGPTQEQLVARLADYCDGRKDCADILSIVRARLTSDSAKTPEARRAIVPIGFVYLLKSGKHYKLGRTNALGRRERELYIQLEGRSCSRDRDG